MLKMLMDPMGGIVMTNDGNAILREITVEHPAAKTMIEISRTQDEEVGDGTTSVIILACDMAIKAVSTVCLENKQTGAREIDIKRYAKVEKVPGGTIEESCVLDGVMVNKDVTH